MPRFLRSGSPRRLTPVPATCQRTFLAQSSLISSELSDRSSPLPHMLPTPDVFSRSLSALGIGDNMAIVIYEQEGVFSAPRAWWMLKTFGAQNVHLLDGGLRAWIEAGLPTESGDVSRAPAAFHAKLDQNAVKDFSQIQQMIAAHAQILDARSAGRFIGALPEPRPGISSGHMPGSHQHSLHRTGRRGPPETRRGTPPALRRKRRGYRTAHHHHVRLWRHRRCHRAWPRARRRKAGQPL